LDEFWKVDIENFYRKEFTAEDKQVLTKVLNDKKPSILEVFKNSEKKFWNDKISLELLYKYLSLIEELSGNENCNLLALYNEANKKENYVLVMNQ
jgi:hypothetical protein